MPPVSQRVRLCGVFTCALNFFPRAGRIALGDVNRVLAHIGDHATHSLIRGLARRLYVHLEVTNAAVVAEDNFCVPPPHARKPVDFIAHDRISGACDPFY